MHYLTKVLFSVAIILVTNTAANQEPAQQPDRLIHPFTSREKAEVFLRTAKIIKSKGTPVGVTAPQRLTLDDGSIQHDALFKIIDDRKRGVDKLARSVEIVFKDSWKFEVAAYEIDKLLSLNMVPVTVERTYKGRRGSLQFWVEGMLAIECEKKKLKPPNPVKWQWQFYKVWIFDKLIFNIDRNLGNILVTPEWKLVMIDHSRCFKSLGNVANIKDLKYFSVSMMKALKELNEEAVNEKCGQWLIKPEIQTMMKRRDRIVRHYENLVEEKGRGITYP